VTGAIGDKSEWSIGEACINVNYKVSGKQAAYVYAMAEKRAKDRVILKLAGLHGVYSEDEADDFKQQPEQAAPKQQPRLDEVGMYVARCKTGISNHTDRESLIAYWKQESDNRAQLRLAPGVPEYDELYSAYKFRGATISQHREAAE
jgi:cytochrome c2